MPKTRARIELTPFLDIILIMFFTLLITVNMDISNVEKERDEVYKELSEIEELMAITEEKIESINHRMETLFNIKLDGNYSSFEIDNFIDDLEKIDELYKNIYFIEIGLKSELNKVYIDGSYINVSIHYEDIIVGGFANKRKQEIKDFIDIDNIKDKDSKLVMISISIHDDNVYKYAYDLVDEVVDEITLEIGSEKVIKRIVYKMGDIK